MDSAGRRYLDFHGNAVHQVGYGNPRVVSAVVEQLHKLPFSPRRYTNRPAIALARKLAELAPGDLSRVLFTTSGATANSAAIQLARVATGRHKTISMWIPFTVEPSTRSLSVARRSSGPASGLSWRVRNTSRHPIHIAAPSGAKTGLGHAT